jgi:hypothetical protein
VSFICGFAKALFFVVVALDSIPTPCCLDLPHTPTVPVLWDTKLETIVNNESSEIIRMFNNVRSWVGLGVSYAVCTLG